MTGIPGPGQPLVRANDWTALDVPPLGAWEPTVSVSVVIPAHNPVHLSKVLAGLAAQSYPAHLLEVVIVDDGSDPPVALPEIRPENTRILTTSKGWGRAATCQHGAHHSDGDVIHWLDADMVCDRLEVEAQLRWHHVIDYAVVLGDKLFTDADALDHLDPTELRSALSAGTPAATLARADVVSSEWIEQIYAVTRRLADAGPRAMRVHTGASASVGRALFHDSGGMPVDLVLGEDIVLGYRLREAGAVFIPAHEARCLHLGTTAVMRDQRAVNRYNRPFVADKVPEFRAHRTQIPRSYEVPYAEVVLPVDDADHEDVRATVDHLLGGSLPDLVVTLTAPWSSLAAKRRSTLSDPALDLRLTRASYAGEPRVRLRDAVAPCSDATFRLSLPGVEYFPVGRALEKLLAGCEEAHLDAVEISLPGQLPARVVRSAGAARAARCGAPTAAAGTRYDASDVGFVHVSSATKIKSMRGPAPWGGASS